jgi:hypothetical protein
MAVKLKVKAGDPKKGEIKETAIISPGRTPLDNTADVRDILTGLVGKGYTTMGDDNIKSGYNRLQSLLGPQQASKLMNHMFMFNSRPDLKNTPVESRIKQFYDTPSADVDVTGTLGKVKSFGYGVVPGFRDSSSQLNQQLSGKTPTDVAVVAPEAVKAVKLKIAGKL